MSKIEQLKEQIAQTPNKFPLKEAIGIIDDMPEIARWSLLGQEYQRGAESVSAETPVLYYLVDRTQFGGNHVLRAIYHPAFHAAAIEIPDDNLGGRMATLLHALEVVYTVNHKAHDLTRSNHLLQPPTIQFRPVEAFDRVVDQIRKAELALIPLMLHPDTTNAVIFNPQARKLSPRAIASSYIEVLDELGMHDDLMRHTMLVTPNQRSLGPDSKQAMVVDIMPHNLFGSRYSLIHTGRIKDWDSSDLPSSYHVTLRNSLPGQNHQLSPEDSARRNAYAAHG